MTQPLPRVSAKHYAQQQDKTAKVKWRIKGNPDGHVYQGQRKVIGCKTCGGTKSDIRMP